MLGLNRKTAITVLVLLAGAWMVGCEDTPLTAPADGEVRLTASPSSVNIDTTLPEDEQFGTSTITAQVFDDRSRVLIGANVIFATSSGTLASGGSPNSVETDGNGIAIDDLVLLRGDDPTVTVSATSGALTQTVEVTLSVSAGNVPPTANLVASPSVTASFGQTVRFDGQSSTDPDGPITCYRFDVNSTVDSSDQVVWGQTRSSIDVQYNAAQVLDVILRVSDDSGATTWCRGGANPPSLDHFSPYTDSIERYEIVCDTSKPVVNISTPSQTLPTDGATVLLSGTGRDSESGTTTYTWDCGNGSGFSGDVPGDGVIPEFACVYEANTGQQARVYEPTLLVYNGCSLVGSDTINVTVLGRL